MFIASRIIFFIMGTDYLKENGNIFWLCDLLLFSTGKEVMAHEVTSNSLPERETLTNEMWVNNIFILLETETQTKEYLLWEMRAEREKF